MQFLSTWTLSKLRCYRSLQLVGQLGDDLPSALAVAAGQTVDLARLTEQRLRRGIAAADFAVRRGLLRGRSPVRRQQQAGRSVRARHSGIRDGGVRDTGSRGIGRSVRDRCLAWRDRFCRRLAARQIGHVDRRAAKIARWRFCGGHRAACLRCGCDGRAVGARGSTFRLLGAARRHSRWRRRTRDCSWAWRRRWRLLGRLDGGVRRRLGSRHGWRGHGGSGWRLGRGHDVGGWEVRLHRGCIRHWLAARSRRRIGWQRQLRRSSRRIGW